MNNFYTTYGEYLNRLFPGIKVQKVSVSGGFTCPNRDGTIGTGGCIYCDNRSFSPDYCHHTPSITAQLERGKQFFGKKYPNMKYLAYFQTYTNTYGEPDLLLNNYMEALADPDIKGLIIGTRPDCVADNLLEALGELNRLKTVIMEYGAESSHNATLSLINRGHTWQQTVDAVERTVAHGISCGLHLIAGLPGEDDAHVLSTIDAACALPIDTLKIHQLQVIRGTTLERKLLAGELCVKQYSVDEYLNLCVKIVKRVPRRIAIERFVSQAPSDIVVSPRWGLKNYQFTDRLNLLLQKQS